MSIGGTSARDSRTCLHFEQNRLRNAENQAAKVSCELLPFASTNAFACHRSPFQRLICFSILCRRQSPNSQQSQKEESAGDCCRDGATKSLISKSLLEPQNKDSNVSNGLDAKTLQTPNRQGKCDSKVDTEQEVRRIFHYSN